MRFSNDLTRKKEMNRFFMKILLVILAAVLSIHSSCPEDQGNDNNSSVPSLSDPIPFDALGQGKLVFQRIGPFGDNFSGVYIININSQMSWGIGGGVFSSPAVSPSGQMIAFTRYAGYEAGTVYDVHIMDIDGSNIQNVSKQQGQDRQPSWTPDSSQILYWVEATTQRLYHQAPTLYGGKGLIKIFTPGFYPVPGDIVSIRGPFSVSLDLNLVFIANISSEGQAIVTMDIDGKNVQVIQSPPPTDAKYYSPAWSPDGQKIAYLLNYKDSSYPFKFLELLVMNADGSDLQSLVKFETNATGTWSGYNDISLCWSPDGSKIAFNKKEEGELISHIYVINADGSGLTQVTFTEGVTDRSLSWSR